jgi:ATP-dependent helicase/DNAse subunit B
VCGFLDSRRGAVLVVSIREVQYAAENELQYERENLEKIYKGRVKWLTGTVGENAFWMPATKQLVFRKGKKIVSVTFSREKNQNEVDTGQVARLVEARL